MMFGMCQRLVKIFFQSCQLKTDYLQVNLNQRPPSVFLKINQTSILYGQIARGQGLFRAYIKVLAQGSLEEVSVANGKDVTTLQLYHARFGHQDKRHKSFAVK